MEQNLSTYEHGFSFSGSKIWFTDTHQDQGLHTGRGPDPLGIGASTAVFSLVNAILLKPPPYPNFERIVLPWRLTRAGINLGYDKIPWGLHEFHVFRRESKTFEHLGAFKSDSFNLTGSDDPLRLEGIRASAGFLPALGVAPAIGRVFTDAEDQPGHEHEVVLGDQQWRDRFARTPRFSAASCS